MHQYSHYRCLRRENNPEKIFEEIIAENFPNMGNESQPSLGSSEGLRQDTPKEEHTKTNTNQTDKN